MRDDEPRNARRRGAWLLPVYDEEALFFIAATCLLLLLAPSGLWRDLAPWLMRSSGDDAGLFFPMFGVVAAGGGLAIYHVFTSRPKNVIEKYILAMFVLITNGSAGIVAGVQVLRSGEYSSSVFPVLNLVFSVLLVYRLAFAESEAIADGNAYIPGLIVGLLVLFALFVCCLAVWHLTWAMTFSVCVGYSTLASRVFTHLDYPLDDALTRAA